MRFILSVWPSACGWGADVAIARDPRSFHNVVQKSLVNLGSLSWITDVGMPKCLTTLWKNKLATYMAVSSSSPMKHGINFLYFDKWSTHMNMALKLCARGRSVMKSILQDWNLAAGMGNGWCNPAGTVVWSLTLLHVSHVPMNFDTKSLSFGYHTHAYKEYTSFRLPRWALVAVTWSSSMSSWRNPCPNGMTSC